MSNVTNGPVHPDGAEPPALVTLHVWGVSLAHLPTAIGRMAIDRSLARRAPGARFVKLLGTADGRTFASRDTDPRHWGLLATWDSAEHADHFEHSRTVRSWRAVADETLRVRMTPVASRGTWSGRQPFGDPEPRRVDGPVAALTRARIKPAMWRTFWSSVPPVAADLGERDGLAVALGVGEAPIGLQGTFSIWRDSEALRAFAHQGHAHRRAIAATDALDWYSEELFARFAVESIDGSYRGRPVRP